MNCIFWLCNASIHVRAWSFFLIFSGDTVWQLPYGGGGGGIWVFRWAQWILTIYDISIVLAREMRQLYNIYSYLLSNFNIYSYLLSNFEAIADISS